MQALASKVPIIFEFCFENNMIKESTEVKQYLISEIIDPRLAELKLEQVKSQENVGFFTGMMGLISPKEDPSEVYEQLIEELRLKVSLQDEDEAKDMLKDVPALQFDFRSMKEEEVVTLMDRIFKGSNANQVFFPFFILALCKQSKITNHHLAMLSTVEKYVQSFINSVVEMNEWDFLAQKISDDDAIVDKPESVPKYDQTKLDVVKALIMHLGIRIFA